MDGLTPQCLQPQPCTCAQDGCPQCDPTWQRPAVRRPDVYGPNARRYKCGGQVLTYVGSMPRRRRRRTRRASRK